MRSARRPATNGDRVLLKVVTSRMQRMGGFGLLHHGRAPFNLPLEQKVVPRRPVRGNVIPAPNNRLLCVRFVCEKVVANSGGGRLN